MAELHDLEPVELVEVDDHEEPTCPEEHEEGGEDD